MTATTVEGTLAIGVSFDATIKIPFEQISEVVRVQFSDKNKNIIPGAICSDVFAAEIAAEQAGESS